MKPLKLIAVILLLNMALFSCSSGGDDNNSTCEDTASASATALTAFNNSTAANHTAKCNAYKNALQNQIDACGDDTGVLQAIIDDLGDCTLAAANHGTISLGVGSAPVTFHQVTISTLGTTRHIHGEDDATSMFIDFDVEVGATGADTVNNFHLNILNHDYTPMPDEDGGNWGSNITVNSATAINGTFHGYASSPDTLNQQDLVNGIISINL